MTAETQAMTAEASATEASARRPTCSIVIPVHNRASLTRQCLNTLLSERGVPADIEIIVVDDGSVDLTSELLRAYGSQIQTIHHDRAVGFAQACNAGAGISTGEYLVFLNNDTIPRRGWLTALIRYAERNPAAAMIGAKLLFPNNTIQHAGVVFGLDRYPHHIYAGFPGDHPATAVSRRFQAVTAACCLFRRSVWNEFGGFDTAFINGWEDVDLCLRLGERGYEIHYCAESVVYHMESASRDLMAPQERDNRFRFVERWRERVRPDDFQYYLDDGLLNVVYPARYPMQLSVSPLLGGVTVGENERLGDRLLHERARQTAILLRNNIVLNVRVHEAEMRALTAEARARETEARLAALEAAQDEQPVVPHPAPDPIGTAGDIDVPPRTETAQKPAQSSATASILGRVESPSREPGVLTYEVLPIIGWALSEAGIEGVETFVDNQPLGTVSYGEPRPDISALHGQFPDGENCGFVGAIPMYELEDGKHDLLIRIIGKDGRVADIGASFEVDSTAFDAGRILYRLDRPTTVMRIARHDRLFVAGWALSPHGIVAVDALMDGEPLGPLAYGALRPDVARLYPFYPSADHSGFSASLSVADLAEGDHVLTVVMTAADDQTATIEIPFIVDATARAVGEVPQINAQYPEWLARQELSGEQRTRIQRALESLEPPPDVTIVAPVLGGETRDVEPLVESIMAQLETRWTLVLAVAAEAPANLRQWAVDVAARDRRIVALTPSGAASFAELANVGLQATATDWVAIVPPDLRLAPTALAEIALDLADHPASDLIYVDDDRVDDEVGTRWDPFFKPDWSPELHLALDYFGPLTLYRRSLLDAIGNLDGGHPGAELYDLALRATERAAAIRHLPRLLASRRSMAGAPASVTPQAPMQAAVASALERRRIAASVEPGNRLDTLRVRYDITDSPGVTVVMPSGGKLRYLVPCLNDLLEKTSYPNLRILILDNSEGTEVAELVAERNRDRDIIQRVPVSLKPFNFSALINASIPHIETPYLILLNDDITIVTPDWIEAMLEHAQRPDIGVVGAKLLYPDNSIQHAGVVLGPYDGTGHAFKFFSGDAPGYFGLPDVIRNYAAVTFACAMMRTDVMRQIGGLDAENLPIAFNDVDFCLKALDAGYRNVYTPHAVLVHHESVTKTVIAKPSEIATLRNRWGRYINHDPYYNPNLTRRAENGALRMD
ncbi:MAG: glycosyltransferase [Thermomicrobiales bacterium]|nr:glycosyltransferase [Thermomicrobiales bacterium]